jgi:hypothetical protein
MIVHETMRKIRDEVKHWTQEDMAEKLEMSTNVARLARPTFSFAQKLPNLCSMVLDFRNDYNRRIPLHYLISSSYS